ncbi:putative phage abortive infection protein [Priestia megaterium]
MTNEEQSSKKNKESKKSDIFVRFLVIAGAVFIGVAVIMPFGIRYYYKPRISDYETIGNMGAIGDFIGGTTVAFLTAASVILLLATIIMQRKEIKISQQSIEELVKQTESSVKQAEEARKETKVTNDTMKKQQFETTFFNMINLHHNILKEIEGGRKYFIKLSAHMKEIYRLDGFRYFDEQFINEILKKDNEELDDLIEQLYVDDYVMWELENRFGIEPNELLAQALAGKDEQLEEKKERRRLSFKELHLGNREAYRDILDSIRFDEYRYTSKPPISNEVINNFLDGYKINPGHELKTYVYEKVYEEAESVVGHYYRNLYRIMKFIQESDFDIDNLEVNEIEKRKYYGILRAQLSSFELMMLFYNVNYSTKGEKFKALLQNTNFFDDHLVEKDFIWTNDKEELKYFAKVGN